jgi:hypothetical protein
MLSSEAKFAFAGFFVTRKQIKNSSNAGERKFRAIDHHKNKSGENSRSRNLSAFPIKNKVE